MKTVCITLLLFAIILFKAGGRSLQHSSSNLVADGNDNIEAVTQTSLLVFGGIDSSEDCSLLSGLFPCSYTVLGKLFLIVGYVLQYIIGEYYVVAGGELIFEVNGSVGANLFHFLSAIPDAIILLGSGVSTEIWTTYAARIMVISIIPVVVSQIPQVLHLSSGGQGLAILIALIVSVILTIAYIFYEVTDSLIC